MDTDTKQMSDTKYCTEKKVRGSTHVPLCNLYIENFSWSFIPKHLSETTLIYHRAHGSV